MRLTARRVAKARAIINDDRCPIRPSIVHRWEFSHLEDVWDYTRGTEPIRIYRCKKCGVEG